MSQSKVPNPGDCPWAVSIALQAVQYCNHGNSGWAVCLCGACETLALLHLLPMELQSQEPATALAEPVGYTVVSRYGGHAGPRSPILKGILVALSSCARREFTRLPMKNHLQ